MLLRSFILILYSPGGLIDTSLVLILKDDGRLQMQNVTFNRSSRPFYFGGGVCCCEHKHMVILYIVFLGCFLAKWDGVENLVGFSCTV